MLQALAKRRNDDRGFTLIELMIVVLIIGILLAVGFPTFLGAQKRAQNRAAQANLVTAMTAAKVWFTDANKYGAALTDTSIAALEPSLSFGAAASGVVHVSDTSDAAPTTVVLTTVSASGTTFCMKDVNGIITYGNSTHASSTCAGTPPAITATTQADGWKVS